MSKRFRLTADQAAQVRRDIALGETKKAVAARFGVSAPVISNILNNPSYGVIEPRPECSIDWCTRPVGSKGLCAAHWGRKRDGRDMNTPFRARGFGRICAVGECGEPHESRGYCSSHASQLRKYGSPTGGPPAPSIHDEVTIGSAHTRVRTLWGSASQYPCVFDCGRAARDWAYDGTDPTFLLGEQKPSATGRTKMFYSRYPEFYFPACRWCHRSRDAAIASREREVFRTIMHQLRMTADEVAIELGVVV